MALWFATLYMSVMSGIFKITLLVCVLAELFLLHSLILACAFFVSDIEKAR